MKNITTTSLVVLVLLMTGCGSRYLASAIVSVDAPALSAAVMDAEVRVLRDLAPTCVSADWSWSVEPMAGTRLIKVSVTTPDPWTSASQCNQIVERYVGMTNAPVRRSIVERAAAPAQALR